jgi:hypothetical protein
MPLPWPLLPLLPFLPPFLPFLPPFLPLAFLAKPFFIKKVGLGVLLFATGALVGTSVGAGVGVDVGAGEMVGEAVGAMVGRVVGARVGFLVGRLVLGLLVGDALVGLTVGAMVGPVIGAFDTDGAAVVGDCVGAFGSTVGTDVGAPVGVSSKRHVSWSAATRHSPLHAPPTKQPEFTPSLKRRGPPAAQRKVASVSGLIKFVVAAKSDALSTKITKSPLPPWKQDSVIVRKDRKSTRMCP